MLIVDDDHDIRSTLHEILSEEGYDVASSSNGREALEVLRSGMIPCLILLDLMMPIMDGWQFRAQQLRDPALAGIPVIVLSADASVEQKSRALNVVGCVKKPVDLDMLLRLVARFCIGG